MNKLFIVCIAGFISCSGNKKVDTITTMPAADTLMDSTQIKKKADTTVKMLDHLEDSAMMESKKAAEKAGHQN